MKFDCPHGWKTVTKIGNVTIEDSTVEICGGVCDSADLCKIKTCQFYDVTREGTARFLMAAAHEQSLEGLMERLTRH